MEDPNTRPLTDEEIQIGREARALMKTGRPTNRSARRAYDRKVERLRRRLAVIQAKQAGRE